MAVNATFRLRTTQARFHSSIRGTGKWSRTGIGHQVQFASNPNSAGWLLPELTIAFTPLSPVIQTLQAFPDHIQKTLMRQAVTSAMRPLRRSAKAQLRGRMGMSRYSTGTAERSLVIKVIQKPGTFTTIGMVGARRGHIESHYAWSYIPKRDGGPAWGMASRKRVPTRYLHLAEKGFVHWMTKKRIPGRKFLFRAILNGKAAAAIKFNETMHRGVNRYLAILSQNLNVKPQPIP